MRILFIHKSVEWIGIEYLSAALKKAGHETDLAFEIGLDGTFYFPQRKGVSHKSIMNKIKSFKPDLILFSATTNLFPWVKEVASEIKSHFSITIIVGGIHPTIAPERVILDHNIDIICVGEGDEAIVELANKIENREPYYETRNFWFKKDGMIIRNSTREPIKNLDLLPLPDKDLFYKYGCFSSRIYIITSRGCPYQCSYCYNAVLRRLYKDFDVPYYRRRSVDSVIEELRLYKEKYKIKSVHFYDDIFNLNKSWVLSFSYRYKKEIKLPYYCLIRSSPLDDELVLSLKESGCKHVAVGFESGNDYVLKNILNRNLTSSDFIKSISLFKKYKISVDAYTMIGLPGENADQMIDTMKLCLKTKPNSIFTHVYYPFPGTKLMDEAIKHKYINEEVGNKIYNGEGNWSSRSIIKHPDQTVIYNIKVILPILNQLPRFLDRYFINSWILNNHSPVVLFVLKIIGIFFCSKWEAFCRVKEQFKMHSKYLTREVLLPFLSKLKLRHKHV